MQKKTLCAAMLLAGLLLCASAMAQELSVELPDAVRSYQPAEIAVHAPWPGRLTIQIFPLFLSKLCTTGIKTKCKCGVASSK